MQDGINTSSATSGNLTEPNRVFSPGMQPGWLSNLKNEAVERFEKSGFPSTRQEGWRFTNVAPIAETRFMLAPPTVLDRESLQKVAARLTTPGMEYVLVFVDGRYVPSLSRPTALGQGVTVGSLRKRIQFRPESIRSHMDANASLDQEPFSALNMAFLQDGAFISVSPDTTLESPIHIVFASSSPNDSVASHTRNIIVAGENSRATIVEHHLDTTEASHFTNVVTQLTIKHGADLTHYKLQEENERAYHVGRIKATLADHSRFTSFSAALGSAISRTEIDVLMHGSGSEVALNGLYVARDHQLVDHHTLIEHIAGHGRSVQNYRGILDGSARGVFNGCIRVNRDAQKTNARMENKNLLLTDTATINTQPQLEINADDVKCSHGATVGRIDGEALFYLRSRGIGEADARGLLVVGFAREIMDHIKVPSLRARVEAIMLQRIAGTSGKELTT